MNTYSTDQIDIAFDVYGQRQPDVAVVLMHGFPDDASAWRPIGSALAAFYHGGLKSITLDDCGHFLHRERPDDVAKLILEFILR